MDGVKNLADSYSSASEIAAGYRRTVLLRE